MAKIEKLGSLYFNGQPQKVGVSYNGEQISIGNAVPGQEIQWVKLKSGLLVADRCVCTKISWKELNEKGYVFGTPITINSETYLCRCLKVGAKENEPNEWDATLDEAGEDNKLWHWKEQWFWGQETLKHNASTRAVRGYHSTRYWYFSNATFRGAYVGFRPVLEYLGSVSCFPDSLASKEIKAYCSGGVTIEGRLVELSDYDIVLKPGSPVPTDCPWITRDSFNIIISRENITWMKEV